MVLLMKNKTTKPLWLFMEDPKERTHCFGKGFKRREQGLLGGSVG